MSDKIIFYDIPSKGANPKSWSLNTWKGRLVLNYKGLPYETEWLEYPNIAPTLEKAGVSPNTGEGATPYSCPAIKLPNGSYIMDSLKIAEAVEKAHPRPPMHMDSPYLGRVQEAVLGLRSTLGPIAIPRIPERLLSEKSAEYFYETRKERMGVSLQELAVSDKAKNAWTNAEPHMKALKEILHEKKGPYVHGEEVSFADFIIAGLFAMVEKLDEEGDLFGRGMKYDECFPKHFEACRKFLERDD